MKNPSALLTASFFRKAHFAIPALCLVGSLPALGAIKTFNVSTGDWDTAASWNSVGAPGVADQAFFTGTRTATLTGLDKTIFGLSLGSTASTILSSSDVGGVDVNVTGGGTFAIGGTVTLDNVTVKKVADGLGTASITATSLDLINGAGISLGQSGGTAMTLSTQAARSWGSSVGGGSISLLANSVTAVQGGTATISVGSGLSFSSAGTLHVTSGTLNLGSSSASISGGTVDFNAPSGSGVLRNSGTLSIASAVTFTDAGAGAGQFQNAGTLNLGGDVAFASATAVDLTGGTLSIDITGTNNNDSDSLTGAGVLTLGGSSLSVVGNVSVPNGTTFTILSGSSLSGTFSQGGSVVASLSGQTFNISYTGTDVTLTAVPEPQHYAAAVGLGLLAFTAWRRQQKRA